MSSMAVAISPPPTSTPCFSPSFTNLHSHHSLTFQTTSHFHKTPILLHKTSFLNPIKPPTFSRYYSDSDQEFSDSESGRFPATVSSAGGVPPPVLKKRKRYRKECPGESKGITEEMRFVAMKLRNDKNGAKSHGSDSDSDSGPSDGGKSGDGEGSSWEPSMEGFLKYLVDSKLVFETLEHVVEDSGDVSYAYFRKTGLERAESLAMDLEWFGQRGLQIPEPSNPGVSYATYLRELAEKSAPLFLSHFYNVYFSHIAGGQVIARQVADKLVRERELELFKWERDAEELLKEVRTKLNMLSEHWSRDDKNKCLKEATKSFRHLGQIVRLIIL